MEGFLSGMHRSPYFGQSIEFVQHRQYVPGDDLRHIDWKVWGRQDRLYIKQYEEDTNLRCTFLVDASESMSYGRGPLNKFDYAATVRRLPLPTWSSNSRTLQVWWYSMITHSNAAWMAVQSKTSQRHLRLVAEGPTRTENRSRWSLSGSQ